VSDLVIIRADQSAGAKLEAAPGPSRVVAGTGGKIVRMPSGARVVAGGELLKSALRNGGVIVGEEPIKYGSFR
jgi:hypothetical protein